ncbi:MAG TPA: hypothetical protein VLF59_05310 [Candidatus Saccharimonadales bacterium]|nr:hypothetical protein [Candidatus Saccharimonadales bacterium]
MGYKEDFRSERLPNGYVDLAAIQWHEWNAAKAELVSRAVGAVALLGGKRHRSGDSTIRTTPWLPAGTDASPPTELRLHQAEQTVWEIAGIPLRRRVAEVRVERRIAESGNRYEGEPYCTYFMTPESGMPALIYQADDSLPADQSYDIVRHEFPAWRELEHIIGLFEQQAATSPTAS